ncbi:hypothetical protein K8R43_00795 [archaeon]|nr:hypothetical protein [archaeon]
MKIIVSVGLHPTEDKTKVIEAVHKIFPGTPLEGKELLQGTVTNLTKFKELTQKSGLNIHLEKLLEKNYCAGATYILLNKQTALQGKTSLYSGQELGSIKLELHCSKEEIHQTINGENT